METYDGTNWTEVADLNTTNKHTRTGTSGDSNTLAIVFGGTPHVTDTEQYDGTSWTEVANMSLPSASRGSAGTSSAAIACGAVTPPGSTYVVTTEEWDQSVAAVTFTSS